jgi:4-amino-4-deoxy-L-arabinose transferase-like glycosyltransferase
VASWLDKPVALVVPLVLALAWKVLWLSQGAFPFNADEAVVALMARHILEGERPLFFYGQAYMGSLDAYLVAAGFWAFGQQVLVIRGLQALLYCGTVSAIYLALREFFPAPRMSWTAALLLSLPPLNLTLYTTVSLGGYGEALLLGSLALWIALRIFRRGPSLFGWVLLGLLCGLGFWVFPLSLVLILPAFLLALASSLRQERPLRTACWVAAFLISGLIGGAPWLIGFHQLGSSALREILGSALAGVSPGSSSSQVVGRVVNLVVFAPTVVFGLRAPWSTRLLAAPLLPLITAVDLGAVLFGFGQLGRRDEGRWARWTLLGVGALLIVMFLATPFGADPSGRYFLPLGLLLAATTAEFASWLNAQRAHWGEIAVLLVLLFDVGSTLQAALSNPPGITTQFDSETQVDMRDLPLLAGFLEQEGETRGYTDYWVEYPLAFLSQEKLLFVARLPYHLDLRYSPRDNRYPPYDDQVRSSAKVAFVTTKNPPLDAVLRTRFDTLGVSYQEKRIGDFEVFYHLSAAVAPADLGLGG